MPKHHTYINVSEQEMLEHLAEQLVPVMVLGRYDDPDTGVEVVQWRRTDTFDLVAVVADGEDFYIVG